VTRIVIALCLAALTVALLAVACLAEQPQPAPPPPVPAWKRPEPPQVTPPAGASWCTNEDACDRTR
jgi:hypothetical protein